MNTLFEKFHEKEVIALKAISPQDLELLRTELIQLNFKELDDFFSLKQTGKVFPWQSINIASIDVFFENKQLDLVENELWDKLLISYLFASIPFQYVDKFLEIVFKIAQDLNLIVEHRNNVCNKSDLKMAFHEYRNDVISSLDGEPGSEIVGINIYMTYPRTK